MSVVLFTGGPWDGELRQMEGSVTPSIDVYVPGELPFTQDIDGSRPDTVEVSTFRYYRTNWTYGGADVYAPCENPIDVRSYQDSTSKYLCGCQNENCPMRGVGLPA